MWQGTLRRSLVGGCSIWSTAAGGYLALHHYLGLDWNLSAAMRSCPVAAV